MGKDQFEVKISFQKTKFSIKDEPFEGRRQGFSNVFLRVHTNHSNQQ